MAIEYHSPIDLNKLEIQNPQIHNLATPPGTPVEGQMYFDTSGGDKTMYFWNGTAWQSMDAAGGGAPPNAEYVTLSADGTLTNEAVLGTSVIMRGVDASKPASATAGLLYFSTDVAGGTMYRDNGATWDIVSTGISHTHSTYVEKATYNANTILKADSDDTPVALAVAEQRLVGRITAGSITDLTAAQVLTLIGVTAGAEPNQTQEELEDAIGPFIAGGDQTNITVTYDDPNNEMDFSVDFSSLVADALFDANTILKADSDNTPLALTVGASTMVGRAAAGNIVALTPTQIRTIINVEDDADVTDATNVDAAGAVMEADYDAHTILAATSDNTPVVLTVPASTFVGRAAAGNIDALTVAEVQTLIEPGFDADTLDTQEGSWYLDRANHTSTQLHTTISDFDTGVQTNRLDQMAAPTAAVDLNSQKITSLANGTASDDAATYGQLLSVGNGRDFKDGVVAATTASGTLSDDFENGDDIDGVTLATGDRILIKNQGTGAENGIYTVESTGAPTRATDADADAEVSQGMSTVVSEGTANGGSIWTLTTADPITVDTTPLVFTKTGEENVYTADESSITLSGTEFSIDTSWTGQTAITTLGTIATGTWEGTTIAPNQGGTGLTVYAIGDIIYADGTTSLAKLADVAVGNVLLSGGVGVAPAWGKVDLTADVTDVLPIANGGTNASDADTARQNLSALTDYNTTIGDNSTTAIVVTHSLSTRNIGVEVYRNSSPWDTIQVEVERTSTSTCTLQFAVAPTTDQFVCYVWARA